MPPCQQGSARKRGRHSQTGAGGGPQCARPALPGFLAGDQPAGWICRQPPASDPLELLDDTLFTLSAFSGLAMESMTRGLGWRFMDMGRRVERAMNQTA
jgi:hypothetical protein